MEQMFPKLVTTNLGLTPGGVADMHRIQYARHQEL